MPTQRCCCSNLVYMYALIVASALPASYCPLNPGQLQVAVARQKRLVLDFTLSLLFCVCLRTGLTPWLPIAERETGCSLRRR